MDPRIILSLFIIVLEAFWIWMFWEMTTNKRLPNNVKNTWMLAFVFFNVFTAVYYYWAEYKNPS